jgi:heterodisulfide reductase subunit B2
VRYSLYPGCTLKTKAKAFEESALKAAEALGLEMLELEEWQCCGAVYPLARDEYFPLLSPVRSLAAAQERGDKLVTLCAACHHVFKRANHAIKNDREAREKVTGYLEVDYSGGVEVIHYLEVLKKDLGFEHLSEKVKSPLSGRKLAAYYGCLLLRPEKEMLFDDPEDPAILEDFLRALGAEAVQYPYRTDCCGAYLSITEEGLARDTVGKILKSARRNGAEGLVVACPLCHYNLSRYQESLKDSQGGAGIPVHYFTELLVEALKE